MVILIIDFQGFFVWHMEFAQGETLSLGLSDLVLHSFIKCCVVNGRDAMLAVHS